MALSACGGGADLTPEQQAERDDAVNEMVEGGVDRGDAECFFDKMVDEFGFDTIDSADFEPTTEDTAKMLDYMSDCNIDLADL